MSSGFVCVACNKRKSQIRRPSTTEPFCRECFFEAFELEVHQTIIDQKLFQPGDRVAIAVSGGKGMLHCIGCPKAALYRLSQSRIVLVVPKRHCIGCPKPS